MNDKYLCNEQGDGMNSKVICGNNIDVLKGFPDDHFDSIVTDPPYGIDFLGKAWDANTGALETYEQCLRVLKPGGHLIAFSAARTYHHLAVTVEQAGFEIRDQIMWIYGSGFPKSQDIGRQLDKKGIDNEWLGWGTALKPAHENCVLAKKPDSDERELNKIRTNLLCVKENLWSILNALPATTYSPSNQAEPNETTVPNTAQNIASLQDLVPADLLEAMDMSKLNEMVKNGLNIVGSWLNTLGALYSQQNMSIIKMESKTTIDWTTLNYSLSQITPVSIILDQMRQDGWTVDANPVINYFNGVLLKWSGILALSAHETVTWHSAAKQVGIEGPKSNADALVLARKPISEKNIADNCIKHGTGALNIDACRVESTPEDLAGNPIHFKTVTNTTSSDFGSSGLVGQNGERYNQHGRFPANVIHDGSDEVVDMFPDNCGNAAKATRTKDSITGTGASLTRAKKSGEDNGFYDGLGSAARFFYSPKVSRKERHIGLDESSVPKDGTQMYSKSKDGTQPVTQANKLQVEHKGNSHPTVKPIELMKYLIRLVTKPGGRVLDPFNGSGSTGCAAVEMDYEYVGIELDPHYVAISEKRIAAHYAATHRSTYNQLFKEDK